MNTIAHSHIESKPGVCGGRPCVAGTRIRVLDVYVWHELQSLSADEIVSRYPSLTKADVYAALSFFWDHREQILQQMQDESDFVEQMKAKYGPGPLHRRCYGATPRVDERSESTLRTGFE